MFYFSDLNFTQKLSILTRCPLQLQPVWAAAISWPILSGSVFTGLACATSWKKMKAIERTTNSSLITPSFLCFTNTSGTNYALIVCKQERASPDSSMSNRDCQLYFFLDGKSQMTKKTWKCNQCSYFSIKVILANSINDFNNWRWHLWIVETKTIQSQTTLMLFQHTVSPLCLWRWEQHEHGTSRLTGVSRPGQLRPQRSEISVWMWHNNNHMLWLHVAQATELVPTCKVSVESSEIAGFHW